MKSPTVQEKTDVVPEFLSGGGEMGHRIREFDWSATSLGPVHTWPQSLRTCIRIMLTSRQPIWIGWGKELIKFYNDPYKAIVGGKHPWALGTPASIVWKDIWKDIEPMLKQVMEEDEGTYVESQLLIMERNGYPEETYYTFSYTPIPGDDGKTAGMFCANTDDTDRIISERQLKTLTQLGKNLTDTKNNEEIVQRTMDTLMENPYDFPFALFRTIQNNKAIFSASTPMQEAQKFITQEILLDSENAIAKTLKNAYTHRKPQELDGLRENVGTLPMGAWSIAPDKAIVLPVAQTGKEPFGLLIIGFNPFRILDDNYMSFFSLIADQMANSFSDVYMLKEERKRAEALAEIDRAKTTFFSNISHEFRTPLTLLLGPIEEALNDEDVKPVDKTRLETAQRNALRMQKLVNTLLEFSRIEAGRMEGKFTSIDICTYTQDLVSTFRSAIEKAGMQLLFDCHEIKNEVYVDVDMWEKIVLNLISNAFKYSKEGSITIKISEIQDQIELSVTDTGIGIPPEHIDKIFDRFHRVENLMGRSQEGTGIGLAMVKELVKLHHGRIEVKSEPGRGSTFTVFIPTGKEHLPSEKIVEEELISGFSHQSNAYVQEAIKWIPEAEKNITESNEKNDGTFDKKYKVLVADDNADMRDYVQRLLTRDFVVTTAVDGNDAFRKIIENKPDLVISDVMMPGLDGFGLLRKIRNRNEIRNLPVIFLSARAGEESKVEGLDAGADDYLVKPFSARELMVRVTNLIRINEVRRETEKQFYQLFQQAPALIHVMKGPDHVFELFHPKGKELIGGRDVTGMKVREALPEFEGQGVFEQLDEVFRNGKPVSVKELRLLLPDETQQLTERYFDITYQPWFDLKGKVIGVLNFSLEVTETVKSRKKIEESEAYFRKMADTVPATIWMTEKDGSCNYLNSQWYEMTGQTEKEALGFGWLKATHPEDAERTGQAFVEANANHSPFNILYRLRQKDGNYRWAIDSGRPRFDADKNFIGFIGSVIDVHEEHEASQKLLESESRYRHIFEGTPVSIWEQDFSILRNEILRLKSNGIKNLKVHFTKYPEELNQLISSIEVKDVNAVTLHLLEANSKEQIKSGLTQIFVDGTKEAIIKEVELIADGGGHFEYESVLKTLKGRHIEVLVHIDFPKSEDYSSVLVSIVDISKRKNAERALRESESGFRKLANAMPQLVWIADAEGKVTYYNDRVREFAGASQSDQDTWVWEGLVHMDDLNKTSDAWNTAVKEGTTYQVEHRVQLKDGTYRWFLSRAFPQKNEVGEIIKWFGTATDIHSSKEYSAILESEVRKRTQELEDLNLSLQQSNKELQQFAHVASHDLKEPLRKIKTFSGRITTEPGTYFSDKAKIYLDKVNSAADRMNMMIDGVLNYSMLNASSEKIAKVDLNQIIAAIETDLELLIEQKSAKLVYDSLPVVEGAFVLLYQLFYNLINNSLKFSREDSTILIEISSSLIHIDEREYAEVIVKDNGIGFEQDFAERIFETFLRLNSKDQYEGTGLGLSLCKRIAERHGGTISAYGEVDMGASFVIHLPLIQDRKNL